MRFLGLVVILHGARVCSNSGYYVLTRIWATEYTEGSECRAELDSAKLNHIGA